MKPLATTLGAAGLALMAGLAAAQHRAESEQAVKKLLADGVEAWNRHDLAAFGQVFGEDADLVAADGTTVKGRAQVEAWHARRQAAGDRQLAWKVTAVRFLRPDVAVVQVAEDLTGQDAKRSGPATMSLTKLGGQWRIAVMHSSPVPGAAPCVP